MSSTRSIISPPPFAANALTVIPPTPVAGVSYRDPIAGPASSPDGWPYAERVNSAEFNQIMYQLSSLISIMDEKGILGWSDAKDYPSPSIQFGSDGNLYFWIQASGPGLGGARDPISNSLYWRRAYQGTGQLLRTSVYSIVSGTQRVSVDGSAPTVTGAATFTPLPTTTFYEAEVQGAGGSGGSTGTQLGSTSAVSGGGGSGSYAMGRITNLATQSITIGIGGAGAGAGGNGNAGGLSSIGSLMSSPGGSGALVANQATGAAVQGGTGQAAAPTGGTILSIRGGPGNPGVQSALNVGNAGSGGSSVFGAGTPGPSSVNTPGAAAMNPGTGSPGSFAGTSSPSGQPTSKAADGIIIIREYA